MNRAEISRMFQKAESLRDWPGDYFPARNAARAALKQWREENPAEAAAEDKKNADFAATEKARKEEEYKNSFIGQHID